MVKSLNTFSAASSIFFIQKAGQGRTEQATLLIRDPVKKTMHDGEYEINSMTSPSSILDRYVKGIGKGDV